MNNRELKYIAPGWIALMIFNYYCMDFFFLGIELLLLIFLLFTITIIQLFKLVKERKKISAQRLRKVLVYTTLFILTLFSWIPNRIIEKADWHLFYSKRKSIVKQVESGELKPNVSHNVCELPYDFPPVSNGGNDIIIRSNTETNENTIQFWIFRNFFDSPSPKFIYTTDKERIIELEKIISTHPDNNWKIEENWYRIYNY